MVTVTSVEVSLAEVSVAEASVVEAGLEVGLVVATGCCQKLVNPVAEISRIDFK